MLTGLRLAGIALVVVAVTTLPFARVTESSHHFSENFKVGPLAPLLLFICALSLLLTALLMRSDSHLFNVMNVILAGSLIALLIVVALAKISDANSVASTSLLQNNTYFGVGIKLALLGAGAILGASVAGINEAKKCATNSLSSPPTQPGRREFPTAENP